MDHRCWDAGAGGTHLADARSTEKAPPKRGKGGGVENILCLTDLRAAVLPKLRP